MRRRLTVLALAAALAGSGSGCGVAEQAAAPQPRGDFGPSEPGSDARARPVAPPVTEPSAAVADALAADEVGVVGVEGDVGVRPRKLEIAADGTLEALRWARWGDRSAEGRGRLRLRDCDPTCASGGVEELPATVRLSAPRLCGRATYFDRADVAVADAAAPASYVRAPC
jgi:hypothetical protein